MKKYGIKLKNNTGWARKTSGRTEKLAYLSAFRISSVPQYWRSKFKVLEFKAMIQAELDERTKLNNEPQKLFNDYYEIVEVSE